MLLSVAVACYGRPMFSARHLALFLAALFAAPTLIGCDNEIISVSGFSLGDMFPSQQNWFWRYNNDGFSEELWWHSHGFSSPDGEEWSTFRIWLDDHADILSDFTGEEDGWLLDLFFIERPAGWYLMGYSANPAGTEAALGSSYFAGDGLPFLLNSVMSGDTWDLELDGRAWTVTASRSADVLAFNSQQISESWRIDLVSETNDWPLEGSYWLAQGPGIVQLDVPLWRPEAEHFWQHLHNDNWANRLGTGVQ
ncbi:MAG: hypothetical protein CMP23_01495 [Rickettsiales bacterium]|nr:hypothetical protein [Rickettsiales bacterium]|tara:strand:- start:1966 stop:2721 length:756 start_codon:yes stop_codon:yes gene_type:complete